MKVLRIMIATLFFLTYGGGAAALDYHPLPSCANQASTAVGCAGSFVAAVGTKTARLIFDHSGGGANTSYTFTQDTDWSTHTSLTIEGAPGVMLSHGAHNLALPRVNFPDEQIFLGSGKVSLSSTDFVKTVWFGPGTSSLPAQRAIEAAANTGATILFTEPTYTVSFVSNLGIRVDKSHIKLASDVRTTFLPYAASNAGLMIAIGADAASGNFVQVHDVEVTGIRMEGNAQAGVSDASGGVYVVQPAAAYNSTEVSYDIRVHGNYFSKFTFGNYIYAGKDVKIWDNTYEDMRHYLDGVTGSGGYDIIYGDVWGIDQHDNTHISSATSRHGTYLSGNANGYPSEFNIHHDTYYWGAPNLVSNKYKPAITSNACSDGNISDNLILDPGFMGIVLSSVGGPVHDVTINNNTVLRLGNPFVDGSEAGGIGVGGAANVGYNVKLTNNLVTAASTANWVMAFGLSNMTSSLVEGNIASLYGDYSRGVILYDTTSSTVGLNTINANSSADYGIRLGGTSTYNDITRQTLISPLVGEIELQSTPTITGTYKQEGIYNFPYTGNYFGGLHIQSFIPSTKYNWLIGAQLHVDNGWEFTPSDTVGGAAFSTPVFFGNSEGLIGLYKVPAAGNYPHLRLDTGATAKGHIMAITNSANGRVDISTNLTFDGTNWNRDDTGQTGMVMRVGAANVFKVSDVAAGNNPATLTDRIFLTVGSGAAVTDTYFKLPDSGYVEWVNTDNSIHYTTGAFYNTVNGTLRHVIASTGQHTMSFYGAGSATFDASGNITSVSDERLKDVRGYFHAGLRELLRIEPIIYRWKGGSGMETLHEYAGFSAQNIQSSVGELGVGVQEDGYLTLQDRALLATIVNAIKELNVKIEVLEGRAK